MASVNPELDTRAKPAPYGQACEACAKSRCKCMLRPGQQACERCHRLNKECLTVNKKRKRSENQGASKASLVDGVAGKTAQLERRLNELEASLKQPTAGQGLVLLPHVVNSNEPASLSPECAADELGVVQSDLQRGSQISTTEAEVRLATFRATYLQWAPFIYLPEEETCARLLQTRPVLWLGIMVTCATEDSDVRRLDKLFRRTIAERMMLQSQKTIDLLLGILVFLTWYHHHCRDEAGNVRSSLSLLLQLAISLVNDLKRASDEQPQRILNRHLYRHCAEPTAQVVSVQTLEERRAFLWCFLASSVVASHLKSDPLRWTAFLDSCLRDLEEQAECKEDEALVQLVKMQVVMETANATRRTEENLPMTGDVSWNPTPHYIQLLLRQLREVRDSWPAHHRNSVALILHYHAIELGIYEFGLAPRSQRVNAMQQHKARHACLSATRSWFEQYLLCSPSEYLATAFPSAIQLSSCLGMLFFLSLAEDPVWSHDDVVETNALNYVDRTIAHMDDVVRVLGLKQDHTLCSHVQLYRSIRATWTARMGEQDPGEVQPVPDNLDFGAFDESLDLGLFDNDWLFAWPMAGAE